MSPASLARESSSERTSAARASRWRVAVSSASVRAAARMRAASASASATVWVAVARASATAASAVRWASTSTFDTSAASSSGERTGCGGRGRRPGGGEVVLELVDAGLQQGLGARGLGGPALGRLGVGRGLAQLLLELGHGGAHALEEVVDLVRVVALAGHGEADVGQKVGGSRGGLHSGDRTGAARDRAFIPRPPGEPRR